MNPLDAKVVRQHERFDCALGAEVSVAPEHEQVLRPSRVSAESAGFAATVVDCGRGGVGIKSSLYFPKHARVRATLTMGEQRRTLCLRVMRSIMSDRGPTYYLGCALASGDAASQEAMNEVMAFVRAGGRA